MRVMALDIGTVRIGVALSDPLGIVANPLKTIDGTEPERAIEEIVGLLKEYEVGHLVIGFPKHMNNTVGELAKLALWYESELKKRTEIRTTMFDERLSSVSAGHVMRDTRVKAKKRKGVVDQIAAVLILQTALDRGL